MFFGPRRKRSKLKTKISFKGDVSRTIFEHSKALDIPPGEASRNGKATIKVGEDSTDWLKNFRNNFESKLNSFDKQGQLAENSGIKSLRATTPAEFSSNMSTTRMSFQLPFTSEAKRMMMGEGLTTRVAERFGQRFPKKDRKWEVLSKIGTRTLRQPAEQLLVLGTLLKLSDDQESWIQQGLPLLVGTIVKDVEKVGNQLAAGEIKGNVPFFSIHRTTYKTWWKKRFSRRRNQ